MNNRNKGGARLTLSMFVTLLLSSACFAEDTRLDTNARSSQKISIGNFVFKPATIEVKAGTEVSWVNEDDVPHTVVGADAASPLKSPALDTEDHYSITLVKPGVYKYFCSLHPHMTGVLIVK